MKLKGRGILAGQSAFVINDIAGTTSTEERRRVNFYRGRVSGYKNSKGVNPPPVDGSAWKRSLDALSIEAETLSPLEIKERARVNNR